MSTETKDVWTLIEEVARVICEGSGTFDGYCHARHEAEVIATRLDEKEGQPYACFTSRERDARMAVA